MKNKILTLLLMLGFIVTSCDISEEPYGFYSEDNFYKTPADAEAALLYVYNAFTYLEYTRGVTNIGDLPTESTDLKQDEGQDAQELNRWTANASNESLQNYFKYCYIAINRANAVIEQVEGSSFAPEIKDPIVGEAYFLKSWAYFSLIRVFGVVPIQASMVKTVNQTTPEMAESLDQLYDLLIADLEKAEALLEINQRVGRVDQVAAWSLLAKAYITIASSKENNVAKYAEMNRDVQTMYDSAAYWSRKVLYEQSEYGLEPVLSDIYNIDKPDGPEHIFILSQDRTGQNEGNYSKTPLMFMPWGDGNPFYVKLADGTLVYTTNGWEVYRVNADFAATYAVNDKRRIELFQSAIYDENGDEVGSVASGKLPGIYCIKYLDPHFVGDKTSAKPYLIRFSDIALVFAEAVGPTTEGYEWINEIRQRAGINVLPSGMGVADFRRAVIRERAWELAFEGHYLYDLRRTASVTSTVPAAQDAGITEEQAAFYAIPQQELDLNPNISRN